MLDGQRAGLVATNSVSQNKARGASLEYIISNGAVITEATSTQVWPGEAKVHVSIVNWVKNPATVPTNVLLDKLVVPGINSSLRSGISVRKPLVLKPNDGRAFQGCIPVGKGFVLTAREARELIARQDADYTEVVKLFLGSDEIANDPLQTPDRWIIDFGVMDLEDAMAYPAALSIVRERVKPERDSNNRATTRESWWRYGEARPALRTQLKPLNRYVAVGLQGKRLLFTWAEAAWVPSNAINAIALDDDWSFGVLTSRIHETWAWEQSSTIKADIRYTPTSAFLTFPFPDPETALRDKIEQASRDVVAERDHACAKLVAQGKKQAGLTAVYNAMGEGAFADLKAAHKRLDEAVSKSYGWPLSVLNDRTEIVDRLYELNAKLAVDPTGYDPFNKEGRD